MLASLYVGFSRPSMPHVVNCTKLDQPGIHESIIGQNRQKVGRQRRRFPRCQVAQVAQIFGGVNTLSGYVRPESVSAEFSTVASEP